MVVSIGDSMTAEYAEIALPAPFDDWIGDLPTNYAEITVPGWESLSWVEVLGALRTAQLNLGRFDPGDTAHGIPRLSGYEYNYGIPGADSGNYRDFLEKWYFWPFRQELDADIDKADVVVVWLGANNFRARYGFLYDGGDPDEMIDDLMEELSAIVEYVKDENKTATVIIGNIPDPGATPDKQAAHPDPVKRARVTAATVNANNRIASLVGDIPNAVLADVYTQSRKIVDGEPLWFGAVRILEGADADNDPRYLFTRDDLHPNTASQIEIARAFVSAFNTAGYAVDSIGDSEALALLGLDPDQPFLDWLDSYGAVGQPEDDIELDGLNLLTEFVFELSPVQPDFADLPVSIVPDEEGAVFTLEPLGEVQSRYANVRIEESQRADVWRPVPPDRIATETDGTTRAFPPHGAKRLLMRLNIERRLVDN